MKRFGALLCALALSGCGKSYSDLQSAFHVERIDDGRQLTTKSLVLLSQEQGRGAESYNGVASISLSKDSIGVDLSVPFTDAIAIPADAIAGCSMTCFGVGDQHVDLLIPQAGIDMMIPSSKELVDWCWASKKPMFAASARRDWQYKRIPLPPASRFVEQLSSRDLYDKQKLQSCLGY
jgi:hypothetical protein